MTAYRSLLPLGPDPFHASFTLEPAAITLPPPPSAVRHQSSGVTGVSAAAATPAPAWTDAAALAPSATAHPSPSARETFFEPPQPVMHAPVYTQSVPVAYATGLVQQQPQQQVSPHSNTVSPPSFSLSTPVPVSTGVSCSPPYIPAFGSAGFSFTPLLERDERGEVVAFQHLQCRPEMAAKSPEELRLEDYALAGIIGPIANTVAPGPVDMGSAAQTGQQQQQQQQPQSAFVQQPLLWPSSQSPQQQTPSAFWQPSQQLPAWGSPQTPGQLQPAASAFSPWGQAQQTPLAWGTPPATWGQQVTSAFQQPQQQQQQQPYLSAFSFPQPQVSQQSSLQSVFGFTSPPAPGPRPLCPQVPQQALFFWNCPAEACFREFMRALPSQVSSISFGGVQVTLPTPEQCRQQREDERKRVAKCDEDPFGLHMLALTQANTMTHTPKMEAQQGGDMAAAAGAGVLPASPLRRGSSSPLMSTPRSPLIPLTPTRSDSLHVPGSPARMQLHGRSTSVSASLAHSPRLAPLPEGPYQQTEHPQLGAAHASNAPPIANHTRSLQATPERRSLLFSSSTLAMGGHSPGSTPLQQPLPPPLHPPAASVASILFASQQEAPGSPSKHMRTPEMHATVARGEPRQLQWTPKLVE